MYEDWRAIARSYRDPYDYSAPVLEFEKQSGIAGINAAWQMPHGRPHAEVEHEICQEVFALTETASRWYLRTDRLARRRVSTFLDTVFALNPELCRLAPFAQDLTMLHDIVFGITSQFPVADIMHFLHVPYEQYNRNPVITAAILAVERRSGARIGWKPAPGTLIRIRRLLDRVPRYRRTPYALCA